MDSYITIKERGYAEYEDRKSVFIGEAIPVSTEAEAIAFIESVKRHYPDARHHVYAYVLRENSTMRFSDDREPQGTAGMPILDLIRKRGCTDIAVVVTRYFGGTLLGTGGLVRAYTSAAQGAIDSGTVITYDIYTEMNISLGYSDYQRLLPILEDSGFRIVGTRYNELVVINGSIRSCFKEQLLEKITELTSARAKIEILCEKFDF